MEVPPISSNISLAYSTMMNNARAEENSKNFVLEESFEINKEWCRKHFHSNKNKKEEEEGLILKYIKEEKENYLKENSL